MTATSPSTADGNGRFTLLYDGACPFCRHEVAVLCRLNGRGKLAVEDIAAPGFDPARYGASLEELMGILHGVEPDGTVVTRVAALRGAYEAVGWGVLLAWTRWPGLSVLADRGYSLFARYRVPFGRLFGAGCSATACSRSTNA